MEWAQSLGMHPNLQSLLIIPLKTRRRVVGMLVLGEARHWDRAPFSAEKQELATAIQDAHTRLDGLGDVNDRLSELESQLDALYVSLQDVHQRIDSLEQVNSR